MAVEPVTVSVSPALYHRLERLAALTHRPVDRLIEQTLTTAIPPLPDDLSPDMQRSLVDLETLDDAALWQVMRSVIAPDRREEIERLAGRRRQGALTKEEDAHLAQYNHEADELMVRKAYAAVLLKWRGHRLPSLADLEASG